VAFARDPGNVTAPVMPPVWITLRAGADIQKALDSCPAGQAVGLTAGAFYAGPLQLRAGVTLLVDRGATLFASTNPRDYDLTPGSCGVVNEAGHGCKPLIGAEGIGGAGVMGDGTIDGRGGEKLTGQNVSWWD